jgi:hypothetical protein
MHQLSHRKDGRLCPPVTNLVRAFGLKHQVRLFAPLSGAEERIEGRSKPRLASGPRKATSSDYTRMSGLKGREIRGWEVDPGEKRPLRVLARAIRSWITVPRGLAARITNSRPSGFERIMASETMRAF